MPRVTLVRYTTKPDRAAENEALSRAVFAELQAIRPGHIAYTLFRRGADFVHLFVNLKDDDASVLVDLPSFKAFTAGSEARYVSPPDVLRLDLDLVEAYGYAEALIPA
jgi:hypothetical protein